VTKARSTQRNLAVTRRTFVIGGMALGGAIGMPAVATSAPGGPPLLLFDGGIVDGRRFAAAAASSGQVAQDTGRDVAHLLYGGRRDWARDPYVILAGVTRYADFQVASGIAREQGRSVVAALAREANGGTPRLVAGSTGRLLALDDRLGTIGLHAARLDSLVQEAGSLVWICA